DLRSIAPEWIELLAGPILKGGYDFVAPLYARHKHDGTITNTVTYPLTRALYGLRIRQPIGGDFGVSGDLVRHYLKAADWTSEVVMSLAALAGRTAEEARARLELDLPGSSTPTTLAMADAANGYAFPDDTWARILYDLIVTARSEPARLDGYVAALVPIYF